MDCFEAFKDEAKNADEIWLDLANDVQVPAVELAHLTATDTYQVRLKFGKPITIVEE